nr:MAG TPA: hypothetical protein [Caudoviricetes sp.]
MEFVNFFVHKIIYKIHCIYNKFCNIFYFPFFGMLNKFQHFKIIFLKCFHGFCFTCNYF